MEGLDSIAQRYGVLPSAVLRLEAEYEAIAVDLWAHNWGVQREAHLMREAERKRRGR